MKLACRAAMFVGVFAAAVSAGGKGDRAGQDLWRSCAACHCVPDPRVPEDEDWLKLNETTTCIAGERDTPEARKALIAYLRSEKTMRPILIDERASAKRSWGKIRLPSTAGSAYLKAERKSVRAGSPPKIRLHWKGSENGTTLAVPPGEYRVINYCFYRLDKKERLWSVCGTSAEGCAQLIISRDKETGFDLLPEIQAHLSCEKNDDGHVLGFFMTNRGGQRMSLSRQGTLVNPTWVITEAEGKQVDRGVFEVT